MARYRERLEEAGAALFADRLPALLRLHHKLDFIRTAASHGFRVPDSRLIGTPADLKEALSAWTDRERAVLKPAYSRFASQVQIGSPRPGRGHIQAPANLSPGNPWVLQQYIEGAPICTYSIVRHGRVVAHAAYEARYRVGLGAAVQFAALDHPGALRWVRRFAEAERLTGQIAFDFIEAPDGELFPIECNPRATSGIHLFAPEDGIAEAVLRHGEPEREQALIAPAGGRQAMIGFAMAAYLLRRGLTWTERREALQALCRSRDVLFRARDPWPVLGKSRRCSLCCALGGSMACRCWKQAQSIWNGMVMRHEGIGNRGNRISRHVPGPAAPADGLGCHRRRPRPGAGRAADVLRHPVPSIGSG